MGSQSKREYRLRVESFDPKKVKPGTYFLVSSRSNTGWVMPELFPANDCYPDSCTCKKRERYGGVSSLEVFYNRPDFIHIRGKDGVIVLGVPRSPEGLITELKNAFDALLKKTKR